MWESEDLIDNLINWDKPPKDGDGAWHAKIRIIDPDGEEFTKTLQSIPTTRKLSETESRKAHLLEDKQIPSVEVFSTWMAFGGNIRDLGSFGEETDKITDLHQETDKKRTIYVVAGDGVAGIKRRRRDLYSDGVRNFATTSGQRSTGIAGVTKATLGLEEARSSTVSIGASTLMHEYRRRLVHNKYLEHKDNFDHEDKEGENLNTGALGTGRTPPGGTSAPAGQAQGGPSPAFVKENIDVLRTMNKELDNRGQERATPRKLFNKESGKAGSENSQMSPSAEEVGGYSSDGSSRSRSRESQEARSRSKSNSVKSKPQLVRASRRK
ncbi:hypothetical protein Tco_0780270 [Tanacetum coccineum]